VWAIYRVSSGMHIVQTAVTLNWSDSNLNWNFWSGVGIFTLNGPGRADDECLLIHTSWETKDEFRQRRAVRAVWTLTPFSRVSYCVCGNRPVAGCPSYPAACLKKDSEYLFSLGNWGSNCAAAIKTTAHLSSFLYIIYLQHAPLLQ